MKNEPQNIFKKQRDFQDRFIPQKWLNDNFDINNKTRLNDQEFQDNQN